MRRRSTPERNAEVRALANASQLAKSELAKAAGIGRQTIGSWMTGRIDIGHQPIERLASKLGALDAPKDERTSDKESLLELRLALRRMLAERFAGRMPWLANHLEMTTAKLKRLLDNNGAIPLEEVERLRAKIERATPVATVPPHANGSARAPTSTMLSAAALVERWGQEAMELVFRLSNAQPTNEGETPT